MAGHKLRTKSVHSVERQRASSAGAAQRRDNMWTPDTLFKATTLFIPHKPPNLPPKSWDFTTGSSNSPCKPHLANNSLISPPVPFSPRMLTTVLAVLNQGLGSDGSSTDTIWRHQKGQFPWPPERDLPTPLSPRPPPQVNETYRKSTSSKYVFALLWVGSYNPEHRIIKLTRSSTMVPQFEITASSTWCSKSRLKEYFPFPK